MATTIPDKPSFHLHEAAALLGVHVDTVRRWIDDGHIRPEHCWRTPKGRHRRLARAALLLILGNSKSK